jgi:carboxylesterase type B
LAGKSARAAQFFSAADEMATRLRWHRAIRCSGRLDAQRRERAAQRRNRVRARRCDRAIDETLRRTAQIALRRIAHLQQNSTVRSGCALAMLPTSSSSPGDELEVDERAPSPT